MPFSVIRDEITKVEADAIVNTANPHPVIGPGTDSAIYHAAGEEKLLAERKKIGDIPVGKAAATPAFDLKAKYIIHTVGPQWVDGQRGEANALRSCYTESLKLAKELNCQSIAFPLISSGRYRFPKKDAIRIATDAIYDFLMENDMMILLVVYDRLAYELSEKIFPDVPSNISDDDVKKSGQHLFGRINREREKNSAHFSGKFGDINVTKGGSFRDSLLDLIREKDLKNADVYHGANITKQHFSKIISNPDYHPKKNTVCALAISLKLNLYETVQLLMKAGMALSDSDPFDLYVRYFIENKMYNIVYDNLILDEKGLELLGTQ